jgi:hypothetical protein
VDEILALQYRVVLWVGDHRAWIVRNNVVGNSPQQSFVGNRKSVDASLCIHILAEQFDKRTHAARARGKDRIHFKCLKPRDEGTIATQTLQIKKRKTITLANIPQYGKGKQMTWIRNENLLVILAR